MARSRRPGQAADIRAVAAAAADRQSEKVNPFARMYAREAFDFEGVDAASLADGIAHTLRAGHALTISLTSDGGAVKVTLWANNQKHIAYAGDAATLNEILEVLGPPLESGSEGKGT